MRKRRMARRKKRKSLRRRYDFLDFVCFKCIYFICRDVEIFLNELDCISYCMISFTCNEWKILIILSFS